VGRELHVTLRSSQPFVKGLYTVAMSRHYHVGGAISAKAVAWIQELSKLLNVSVSVSPQIKNAPMEWVVRDYPPTLCHRVVRLPTTKSRAVVCVDERLADIAFINEDEHLMDTVRIPGPDPKLLSPDDDLVVVQHGHCDPREDGISGEASWRGCGWRTAQKIPLKDSGWDFFLLHDESGKVLNLRTETEIL
jgi:hypothetical protein